MPLNLNSASIEKSLRHLSVQVRLYGREILKEYKLSKIQFIALQWVSDSNGQTIGEVAKKLDLAYSTTTDIIDKLECSGFVRRERGHKDKRVVLVKIEQKGTELLSQVIKKRVQFIDEITSDFTEDEKEMLSTLLKRMISKSETMSYEQ